MPETNDIQLMIGTAADGSPIVAMVFAQHFMNADLKPYVCLTPDQMRQMCIAGIEAARKSEEACAAKAD